MPVAVTDTQDCRLRQRQIELVDVPEKPSVLPSSFSIIENLPTQSQLGTVSAFDQDADDSGSLRFSVQGQNFDVNFVEGRVKLSNALNYEKKMYIKQPRVRDSFHLASSSTPMQFCE